MDPKQCILEVKAEYIDYLTEKLYRSIYRGLQKQWDLSKRVTANAPENVWKDFQMRLASMKNLNDLLLKEDYDRVLKETGCDNLDDIIQKCVVLSTQALSTVNQPSESPISIVAPKGASFLHRCYVYCARDLYERVWIMEDRRGYISSIERGKNLEKMYKLIKDCIRKSVKYFVPWKELAKKPLNVEGYSAYRPAPHMMFGNQGWHDNSSSSFPPVNQQQQNKYPLLDNMFKSSSEDVLEPPRPTEDLPSSSPAYDDADAAPINEHEGDLEQDLVQPSPRSSVALPTVNEAMEKVIYFEPKDGNRPKSPMSDTEEVTIVMESPDVPVEPVENETNADDVNLTVFPLNVNDKDVVQAHRPADEFYDRNAFFQEKQTDDVLKNDLFESNNHPTTPVDHMETMENEKTSEEPLSFAESLRQKLATKQHQDDFDFGHSEANTVPNTFANTDSILHSLKRMDLGPALDDDKPFF